MRIFKKPGGKTFLVPGRLPAHEAGNKAGHGLHDGEGRGLAAIQDDISHAHGLEGEEAVKPRVKSLVASAEKRDVSFQGKLAHEFLIRGPAVRRLGEHAPGPFKGSQGCGHGCGLHEHARSPAVRTVVHVAVPVCGKFPRIMKVHGYDSGGNGPAHESGPQGRAEKIRKQRDNVEGQHVANNLWEKIRKRSGAPPVCPHIFHFSPFFARKGPFLPRKARPAAHFTDFFCRLSPSPLAICFFLGIYGPVAQDKEPQRIFLSCSARDAAFWFRGGFFCFITPARWEHHSGSYHGRENNVLPDAASSSYRTCPESGRKFPCRARSFLLYGQRKGTHGGKKRHRSQHTSGRR